jgi:hypothetical protein
MGDARRPEPERDRGADLSGQSVFERKDRHIPGSGASHIDRRKASIGPTSIGNERRRFDHHEHEDQRSIANAGQSSWGSRFLTNAPNYFIVIASPLRSAFAISLVCFSSRSRDVFIISSCSSSLSGTKPRPPHVGHWRSSSVSLSTTPSPLQSGQVFMCVCVCVHLEVNA